MTGKIPMLIFSLVPGALPPPRDATQVEIGYGSNLWQETSWSVCICLSFKAIHSVCASVLVSFLYNYIFSIRQVDHSSFVQIGLANLPPLSLSKKFQKRKVEELSMNLYLFDFERNGICINC